MHKAALARALCRGPAGVEPVRGRHRKQAHVAALEAHKDQTTLLRAARHVVARRPDVTLVVVGDGRLKSHLLGLRSELGLDDAVRFTGFIPNAQRLLPGFDVLVMSSRQEGLGTIVLDNTVDELVAFSEGASVLNSQVQREGVVLRPLVEEYDEDVGGRLSFKAINPKFLLKYDE